MPLWRSALVLLAVSLACAEDRAVVVGISEYRHLGQAWLQFAHLDGGAFAKQVGRAFGVNIDLQKDMLLNTKATRSNILGAVRNAAGAVGGNDTLYFFISGRGRTVTGVDLAYIDTFESPEDRASISVTELFDILHLSNAGRIIIFADLCRPDSSMETNQIHSKLRSLRDVRHPLVGFLAAEPGRTSFEPPAYKHGVFSFFLLDVLEDRKQPWRAADLDHNGTISASEIEQYLQKQVADQAKVAQRPIRFVNKKLERAEKDPVILRRPSDKRTGVPAFDRIAVLAMLGRPAGLGVATQKATRDVPLNAESEDLRLKLHRAIRDRQWFGTGGAVEIYEQLAQVLPEAARIEDTGGLATALEDAGQQVVARYGSVDVFATDGANSGGPRRDEYAQAARVFEAAERFSADPIGRDFLRARRFLCEGLAQVTGIDLVQNPGAISNAANRFQQAIQIVQHPLASKQLAYFAEPYNALGVVLLAQAEYDAAARHFRNARDRAPRWAFARHNLALALIAQHRYDEALAEYRTAVTLTPYYPYLQYSLGLLLQRMHRMAEARQVYETAVKVFSDQSLELETRVNHWQSQGNSEEAALASATLELYRKNIGEVRCALGVLEDLAGEASLAEQHYRAALAAHPRLIPAAHNLGLLLLANGQRAEALSHWRAIAAWEPDFLPSRFELARELAVSGDLTGAIREYRLVLDAQPQTPAALIGLARALAQIGSLAEAIAVLRRDMGPTSGADLKETLGDLYSTAGDSGEACRQFSEALDQSRRNGRDSRSLSGLKYKKVESCRSQ